jgi:argininosuccinate lyase
VLQNLSLNEEQAREAAATGHMNATEVADYLVRKGMPFREAHEVTGRIVIHALESGVELDELPLAELQSFASLIQPDIFNALTLDQTLATKSQRGGTAPNRVREALAEARARLLL